MRQPDLLVSDEERAALKQPDSMLPPILDGCQVPTLNM
jgi:hypothetical protein